MKSHEGGKEQSRSKKSSLWPKRKCVEKSMMVRKVKVMLEKTKLEILNKENETTSMETGFDPEPSPCELPLSIDTSETKETISNWKELKIERKRWMQLQEHNLEIKKQREEARIQLDQIKNTTGFEDNMDATMDFLKIIECTK
ncbi:hypothetical protein VNO77_29834 [Canavalia gladiata]|uniref:Uncharacterized protein n=1 Tax=Canavalia gladiata TaxID=3824 RepID=A0AAN9Q3A1_CANGL